MKPTVGRIVLVRSPAFIGECPAIVTRVWAGADAPEFPMLSVRVFTNDDDACPHLAGVGKQDESTLGWGWRWPPREENPPQYMVADVIDPMGHVHRAITQVDPTPNTIGPEQIRAFKKVLAEGVDDAGGLPGSRDAGEGQGE